MCHAGDLALRLVARSVEALTCQPAVARAMPQLPEHQLAENKQIKNSEGVGP